MPVLFPWLPKERESAGFICKAPDYQRWEGMMMVMMMNEDAKPVCFLCCELRGVGWLADAQNAHQIQKWSLFRQLSFQGVSLSEKAVPKLASTNQLCILGDLEAVFPLEHQFNPTCLESAIPDKLTAVFLLPPLWSYPSPNTLGGHKTYICLYGNVLRVVRSCTPGFLQHRMQKCNFVLSINSNNLRLKEYLKATWLCLLQSYLFPRSVFGFARDWC